MPAYVEERPNLAGGRAHHDHRLCSELDDEVIARAGDAARMSHAEPMREQHALEVEFKDGGIGIELARQRMPGPPARDESLQLLGRERLTAIERQRRLPCPGRPRNDS